MHDAIGNRPEDQAGDTTATARSHDDGIAVLFSGTGDDLAGGEAHADNGRSNGCRSRTGDAASFEKIHAQSSGDNRRQRLIKARSTARSRLKGRESDMKCPLDPLDGPADALRAFAHALSELRGTADAQLQSARGRHSADTTQQPAAYRDFDDSVGGQRQATTWLVGAREPRGDAWNGSCQVSNSRLNLGRRIVSNVNARQGPLKLNAKPASARQLWSTALRSNASGQSAFDAAAT
jgi:hypothetical protein